MKIKAKLEPKKVALVTGGSSGIGKAIACGLARRGMHVWLVAQRKDLLESARKEVEVNRQSASQTIGTVSADVSELDQVRFAVKHVSEKSGPPDLLVNSAGVTQPGYVQDLDISIFSWMMEVNYFGTVYITKEVLPSMIKRGSGYILNISSGAGFLPFFGYTAYGASKFAVRGFSDTLRQEMKLHGIGVSVLYPPDTDTPQYEYEQPYKPIETKALTSVGGLMSAEAVAHTAIRGIERGQREIIPGFEVKLIFRLYGIAGGLVDFVMDRIVAGANQNNNPSRSKEA